MSKIGLRVTKISGGVQELLTINGGDWTRKVVDIRTDIKVLSGKSLDDGSTVVMLSYIPTGCLVTLFHTLAGRSGDLISAWIFLPGDSHITADDEMMVLDKVKTELSKSLVDNWNELEALLSKDYPKKLSFQYKESVQTNPCAVRYYGIGTDYGLKELLGDRIYQVEYLDHKYVFLLDKSVDIVADDKLANYTDQSLKEWIVVCPPQLPEGVTLKQNGRDFTDPIVVFKGQPLQLSFEKQGFLPLPTTVAAGSSIVLPESMPWHKHISPASFFVTDSEKKDLNASCQIKLNNQYLDQSGVNLSEKDCAQVQLMIYCPDYEEFSGVFNLLSCKFPIPVLLKHVKTDEVFCINNTECPNLTQCPELYEVVKEVRQGKTIYKYCEPVPQTARDHWKKIAIIAVAALLIGFLLGFVGHALLSSSKNLKEQISTENNDNSSVENTGKTKILKTYSCLQDNKWEKDSIDAEPDLKGLFDDIQGGRLYVLMDEWCVKVDTVKNPEWGKIVRCLKQIKESGGNIDLLSEKVAFDSGKTSFVVSEYIELLNENNAQTVNSENNENSPSER